jgi:hypothetical protein
MRYTPVSSGTKFPLENGAIGTTKKPIIAEAGLHDDAQVMQSILDGDFSVTDDLVMREPYPGDPNTTFKVYEDDVRTGPLMLAAFKILAYWINEKGHQGFHHTEMTHGVNQLSIDPDNLRALDYKFTEPKGRSNLKYFQKKWQFPGLQIVHQVHLSGTSVVKITPNVVQTDPSWVMDKVSFVLNAAFASAQLINPRIRCMEISRADSGELVKMFQVNNWKQFKFYLHDNYELRGELSVIDPELGPTVFRMLGALR